MKKLFMSSKHLTYKVFLFLALFFLKMNAHYGQSRPLDTLLKVIRTTNDPKAKAQALVDFSFAVRNTKKDTSLLMAREALQLSKNIHFYSGMGIASYIIGNYYYLKNNDSSLYYFKQSAYHYSHIDENIVRIARTYSGIINAYLQVAKYDSAIQFGKRALSIIKARPDTGRVKEERLMYLNGTMGTTYYYASTYDSSAVYYMKAIDIAEKMGNHEMLGVYYLGIANVHAASDDFANAIVLGKKSATASQRARDPVSLVLTYANIGGYYEKIDSFDMAKKYIDSSITTAHDHDSTLVSDDSYRILGNIEFHYKNYPKALEYYKKGLSIIDNEGGLVFAKYVYHRKFAEVYLEMDSLQQAKREYQLSLQMAKGDNHAIAEALIALALVYKREGNYLQAYETLERGKKVYDSVFNADKNRTVQELNVKYETQNKERKLLLLENEKLIQQREIEKQGRELAARALLVKEKERTIEIAKLLAGQQLQQMTIQNLTLSKNENDLQQQRLALSNANQQLQVEQQEKALQQAEYNRQKSRLILLVIVTVLSGIILALYYNRVKIKSKAASQQALLQERLRISRELHDEVGATLSGIVMYSHFTKDQIRSSNISAVENSLNIMQQSSEEMVGKLNEIVWLVNPDKDNLQRLVEKLEEYAENMAAIKNMMVKVTVPPTISELSLDFEHRRNIYLVCKEAINNAVKYSNGTLLSLSIKESPDKLSIMISDNGKGFAVEQSQNGNGLVNMRKRAEEIGAKLVIESSKDRGTVISMESPI